MRTCGAAQFGPETQSKHEQLGGFFRMYAPILDSLHQRRFFQEAVYIDLNAGPGIYDHGAYGSPVLAANAFHDRPYISALHCFEQDAETYAKLTANTAHFDKLIAHHLDNAEGIHLPSISQLGRRTHGLVFSDPNGKDESIPLDVLRALALRWHYVDILCYLPATKIKRVRCAHGGSSLREQLLSIGKAHMRVRVPKGAQQWTFALLTNWPKFPEWKAEGWVNASTARGLAVLDWLDLTEQERFERSNPSLFDSLTPPTLSTSDTQSSAPCEPRS